MSASPISPSSTSGAVFSVQRLVRFSDCDPAGMVFYPQYFVMLNGLVEDWFTQGLGVNYAHLLGPRRIGLPMVSLQADFKLPSRMGDTIALQLQLARKGRRSLTLQVRCLGTDNENDTVRWTAQAVIVTTSLAHDGAIDIPQDVHEGVARWQMLSGETP